MKTATSILVLCSLVFLLPGVMSASPETSLIGPWMNLRDWTLVEFLKDGTLIVGDQGARYRIIDKQRLEIDLGPSGQIGTFAGLGTRPIFKFTVSDKELTLIPLARPDYPHKFRRVKADAVGNTVATYFKRGVNNSEQRRYQEATKDFGKAIELDPEFKELYIMRAYAHRGDRDFERAIKDWGKVIEMDPQNMTAYHERAADYIGLDDYQRAIRDYSTLIELDPENWKYYADRAQAYAWLRNDEEAVKDLDKVIELRPKDLATYYVTRAELHQTLGNYPKAIEDWEKVSEHDPRWRPLSYVAIVRLYSTQSDGAMACQYLKRIEEGLAESRVDRDVFFPRGWDWLRSGAGFDSIRNAPCFRKFMETIVQRYSEYIELLDKEGAR